MVAKRTRGSGSPARSPKKARVTRQVNKALEAVADALADRAVDIDGPKTNRKMLQGAVVESLGMGAAKDERHKYQDLVIGYIASVLQADEQKHQAAAAAAQGEFDAANAALTASNSGLGAAQGTLDAKKSDIKAKKDTLSDITNGVKNAESELATAKDEVDNFDGIQAKKASERDQCYAALHSSLDALKKGEWANKSEKNKMQPKHISAVMKALKCTDADAALMASFSTALELAPDARGSFDSIVVETVEKKLTKHVDGLNAGLSDGPGLKAKKEAGVTAAQAALEAAQAALEAAQAALKAAEQERPPLDDALKAAQQGVKDAKKGVEKKADALKDEQRILAHATETLASFNYLSERPAVEPEPHAPEAEPAAEEPVAEDAA